MQLFLNFDVKKEAEFSSLVLPQFIQDFSVFFFGKTYFFRLNLFIIQDFSGRESFLSNLPCYQIHIFHKGGFDFSFCFVNIRSYGSTFVSGSRISPSLGDPFFA